MTWGGGAFISPTICAGVTGLLVGIGMGIGFGALMFDCYRNGRVGGGIWFGKRRRRRSAGLWGDDDDEDEDLILDDIDKAAVKYGSLLLQ